MPPAIAPTLGSDTALKPFNAGGLSDLIGRLQSTLSKSGESVDDRGRTIIQRLLEEAAVAEQTLAEQKTRIAYLESLSVTDDLTGLYNRRGFEDVLRRTLTAAHRYKEQGMLAFIDLDSFKAVNDLFGHAAGDAVLRRVADVLRKNTRTTDYVARLGGDEFAILFVRAEQMPTRRRALKILDKLNGADAKFGGLRLPISASLGLEPYGPHTDLPGLLQGADAAMYQDKERRKSAA